MFKSSTLSQPLTRTVLSALTATALFSVASISNAALFKNNGGVLKSMLAIEVNKKSMLSSLIL